MMLPGILITVLSLVASCEAFLASKHSFSRSVSALTKSTVRHGLLKGIDPILNADLLKVKPTYNEPIITQQSI